mgnify:CR=1 FL=1
MNFRKILAVALALLLVAAGGSAWAHGPRIHRHVGVYVGAPLWGPWWYPPPVYYPTPVVIQPAPPPVYIEQYEAPQNYWYYCKSGKGYYPYVKECPEGWQKVLPQPEK